MSQSHSASVSSLKQPASLILTTVSSIIDDVIVCRCSWLIGNRCLPSVIQTAFDNCNLYVHVVEDAVDGAGDAGVCVNDSSAHAGSSSGGGSGGTGTASGDDRSCSSSSNSSSSSDDASEVSMEYDDAVGLGFDSNINTARSGRSGGGGGGGGDNGGSSSSLPSHSGDSRQPLDPFVYIVTGDIQGFTSRIASNPEYLQYLERKHAAAAKIKGEASLFVRKVGEWWEFKHDDDGHRFWRTTDKDGNFSIPTTDNPCMYTCNNGDGNFPTDAQPYDPEEHLLRNDNDEAFLHARANTWPSIAKRNLKNEEDKWDVQWIEHMSILYKQAVPGLIEDEPHRKKNVKQSAGLDGGDENDSGDDGNLGIDPDIPPPPPPVWSLQISTKAERDSALRIVMPAHAVQQINLHTRFFFPWNYRDMDPTVIPAPNGQRLHTALEITAEFHNMTRNAFSVELPFANIEEFPVPEKKMSKTGEVFPPDKRAAPTPSAVVVHASSVQFKYVIPQIVGADGYKAKFDMICKGDVSVATAFTFGVVDVIDRCRKMTVHLHMPAARVFGEAVEWKCFVGIDDGIVHRNANQTTLLQAFGKCLGQKPSKFSESDFSPISYAIVAELRNTPVYFGANQHNLYIPAAETCKDWFAGFDVSHSKKKKDKSGTQNERWKQAKIKRDKANDRMAAAAHVSIQGPLITVKANIDYTAYISPLNVASYAIDVGYVPAYRLWTAEDVVEWASQFDSKWEGMLKNAHIHVRDGGWLSDLMSVNNVDGEKLSRILSGEVEIATIDGFTEEMRDDIVAKMQDDEAVAAAASNPLNATVASAAPTPMRYRGTASTVQTPRSGYRGGGGGGGASRGTSTVIQFSEVVGAALDAKRGSVDTSGRTRRGGGDGTDNGGVAGLTRMSRGPAEDIDEDADIVAATPGLFLHLPEWHTIAFHERVRDHRLHFDHLKIDIATRYYDGRFFDDQEEFLNLTNSVLVGVQLESLTGGLSGVIIKYLQQWVANQFGAKTAMRTSPEDIKDVDFAKLRIHTLKPADLAPPTSVGMTIDADDTKFGLMTRLYDEDRNGCEAASAGASGLNDAEDGIYPLSLMVSKIHFGLVSDRDKMHVSANLHGTSLLTKETVCNLQSP